MVVDLPQRASSIALDAMDGSVENANTQNTTQSQSVLNQNVNNQNVNNQNVLNQTMANGGNMGNMGKSKGFMQRGFEKMLQQGLKYVSNTVAPISNATTMNANSANTTAMNANANAVNANAVNANANAVNTNANDAVLGGADGNGAMEREVCERERAWRERVSAIEAERASMEASLQQQLSYNAQWHQSYSALESRNQQLVFTHFTTTINFCHDF